MLEVELIPDTSRLDGSDWRMEYRREDIHTLANDQHAKMVDYKAAFARSGRLDSVGDNIDGESARAMTVT